MEIAQAAAKRGSCPRLQVGAVLVDSDHGIVSTGFNGAPRGLPSCLDEGCLHAGERCIRSLHAELNVLLQAGRNGASTIGTTLYVTHRPCYNCSLHIIQAGIKSVVFSGDYKSDNAEEIYRTLHAANIEISQLLSDGGIDWIC